MSEFLARVTTPAEYQYYRDSILKREDYTSWLKDPGLRRLCDDNGGDIGLGFITSFIQYWSFIHKTGTPAILVAIRKSLDHEELTSMRVLQMRFVDILTEYSSILTAPITSTEFSGDFIEPEEVKGKFLVVLDPLEEHEASIADMCSKANVPAAWSLQLFLFGSTENPLKKFVSKKES